MFQKYINAKIKNIGSSGRLTLAANHLNAQAKHEVPKQRGVETRRTPTISISDDTPPVPKTSKRDFKTNEKL
jgi:hypothetical protein